MKDNILYADLKLEELELGAFTPRLKVDQNYLDTLADDIKSVGLQKPILCRLHPENLNRIQVVDGEQIVRAIKRLGWKTVRSEVKKMSDEDAMFLAMHNNEMHGLRLDQMEEALHLLRLASPPYNWAEWKIAEKFGKSQPWVHERLDVARNVSEALKKSMITRVITTSQARHIAQLPSDEQEEVVNTIAEPKLSVPTTKVYLFWSNP